MGSEKSEEDHDEKNKTHRPSDPDQKRFIATFMLGNVHGAVDIVGIMICHS
jgi:hypothetical protein